MSEFQKLASGLLQETTLGFDLDESQASRARVLIVDDDADYLEMMKIILRKAGFDVATASDHRLALEKCAGLSPDLILLDLMMPEIDGWELYEMLRGVTQAPIVMITASANRDNAVRGLEIGMAEYISKPFYTPEMIARLKRVLQSVRKEEAASIQVFPEIELCINYLSREVMMRGEIVRLSRREFELLALLARRAPHHVLYEDLTTHLWGEDSRKNRVHLKTVVFSLRQKLEEQPSAPNILVNYRNVGYQLLDGKNG